MHSVGACAEKEKRAIFYYSLICDEAFVRRITWKSGVEHVSVFCEHVILKRAQGKVEEEYYQRYGEKNNAAELTAIHHMAVLT